MQEAVIDGWTREAQFSAASLAPLHDLNHRFLDLLARDDAPLAATLQCAELARALRGLRHAQRAAAARCPYALFDLRFADAGYWRRRLVDGAPLRVEDHSGPANVAAEFARLALFYAWHVVASRPLAGEVLLGMQSDTALALRATTLNSVAALAVSESAALAPRFAACGRFWDGIIGAAARGDTSDLRRVQLFGLQLTAAARLERGTLEAH